MRTATTVVASGAPWRGTADHAVEAERIGLDACGGVGLRRAVRAGQQELGGVVDHVRVVSAQQ